MIFFVVTAVQCSSMESSPEFPVTNGGNSCTVSEGAVDNK